MSIMKQNDEIRIGDVRRVNFGGMQKTGKIIDVSPVRTARGKIWLVEVERYGLTHMHSDCIFEKVK